MRGKVADSDRHSEIDGVSVIEDRETYKANTVKGVLREAELER